MDFGRPLRWLSSGIERVPKSILYGLSLYGVFKLSQLIHSSIPCIQSSHDLQSRYGESSWALITGAGQGIGEAWATELAKQGFNLVLVDIQSKVISVSERLSNLYTVQSTPLVLDLQNPDSVPQIVEVLSSIDLSILINNAGTAEVGNFIDQTSNQIQKVINTNLMSTIDLTKSVLPLLLKREKRSAIVFMSSLAASIGMPSVSIYAGTKGFIKAFSLSLNYEVNELIDVMCVEPAMVSSSMNDFAKVNQHVSSPQECVQGAIRDMGNCASSYGSYKHQFVMHKVCGGTCFTNEEHAQVLLRASEYL